MAATRFTVLRASRLSTPRVLRSVTPIRTYAKDMKATQGQASPGTASNVASPGSVSADQQSIKQNRATDSTASPDTASVQTPVSNPSGAGIGQQEDDTSTQQTFKQDPNTSAEEKRKQVDKQGQKPLDPANK
ncbi:hypothetical protein B9Z65_2366 [Elsinoe australis]|uniref:HAD-like protein n=1 Tax=Elsinoe australis TaxID=40998 RepID=A0A2P7ZAH8_9PEZI|nr:hypothetical protein B9Z65_2366 [Elsinoe australis]